MKLYQSYNFRDKDPIIYLVRDAITASGKSYSYIERHSGVTTSTLRSWFFGPTKRPQFATVQAVLRSIGKELTVHDRPATPRQARKV